MYWSILINIITANSQINMHVVSSGPIPLVGMTLALFLYLFLFLGLVNLYVNVACAGSCSPIPPLLWTILASPGHLGDFMFLGKARVSPQKKLSTCDISPKAVQTCWDSSWSPMFASWTAKNDHHSRKPRTAGLWKSLKIETPDKGVDRKAPCVPTQAESTSPAKNQILGFH